MARQAEAEWKGDLKGGSGRVKLGSGAYEGNYSFATRFENGSGANPEELIGAALAGCFSMALANSLAQAGFTATSVHTNADVHLGKDDTGFLINLIELTVDGGGAERRQRHVPAARREDQRRLHHQARPGRGADGDRQGDAEELGRSGIRRSGIGIVKTVRLVHWNEDEGLERQQQLEAFGFDAGVRFRRRRLRDAPDSRVASRCGGDRSHAHAVARPRSRARPAQRQGDAAPADRVRRRRAGKGRDARGSCCPTRSTRRGDASRRRCRRRSRGRRRTRSFPITTLLGQTDRRQARRQAGFKVALLASPKGFADTLKPLAGEGHLHGAPRSRGRSVPLLRQQRRASCTRTCSP